MIEGVGCREFWFLCTGFRVQGSSFTVHGSRFKVWVSSLSAWRFAMTSSACMRSGFCVSWVCVENIEVFEGSGFTCLLSLRICLAREWAVSTSLETCAAGERAQQHPRVSLRKSLPKRAQRNQAPKQIGRSCTSSSTILRTWADTDDRGEPISRPKNGFPGLSSLTVTGPILCDMPYWVTIALAVRVTCPPEGPGVTV